MQQSPHGHKTLPISTWSWSAPASPGSTCCTGCASSGSPCGCSRPPTTSAAPGTGTATRARAATSRASTTPTASTPSSRPSGSGRRSTRRSPRSSATCSTSPTSTTCAATSGSRRASRRRRGTTTASRWRVRTERGDEITCRFYVMATGCLSLPKSPDIAGAERFARRGVLHQPLAARGRRLHRQAGRGHRHRVVGRPVDPDHRAAGRAAHRVPAHAELLDARPQRPECPQGSSTRLRRPTATAYREAAQLVARRRARGDPTEVERAAGVRGGAAGELRGAVGVGRAARDPRRSSPTCWSTRRPTRPSASSCATRSARSSTTPRRPRRCARRTTTTAPSGRASTPTTTRPSTCRTSAWSTCARRRSSTITETGIDTADESFEFDAIVFATGLRRHDRRASLSVDITGRDGVTLEREVGRRSRRPTSDSTTVGFPNFFIITGPGQPVGAVEHGGVDRAARRLGRRLPRRHARRRLRHDRADRRRPRPDGCSTSTTSATSRSIPSANSWYMGANVPGKPRVFLPYIGGVDAYRTDLRRGRRARLPRASRFGGRAARRCNDGVIRRLQPDVAMVLEMMAELGLPPIESLSPEDARAFMAAAAAMRPPGPEVGEIVDGVLPGAAGDLPYRLYRPASAGAAPDRRVLPRRRLGARRARLRRSVLSRPLRAVRCRSSSRSTTATRPRRASPPPSTMGSPPCGGSPTTPSSSAASRASWRSAAGAQAPTSPRWSASSPATRAGPRSPVRCC